MKRLLSLLIVLLLSSAPMAWAQAVGSQAAGNPNIGAYQSTSGDPAATRAVRN